MKYKDPITGEYKELFLKASDTLPIGAIVPYGSDDIPTNWLLCDGSEVSRTTYANLFSVIGTNFGEGDGETTFNLPDFRSRIPLGKDTSDEDFDILGKIYGEKEHTLTIAEMPSHNHKIQNNKGAGTQNWGGLTGVSNTDGVVLGQPSTLETGGSQPHNIVQPSLVTNYIIKSGMSVGVMGSVVNEKTDSSKDTYSCDYINGIFNKTLLWKNSNINDAFEEQDITLTSDDYDELLIYFKFYRYNECCKSINALKGYSTVLDLARNYSPGGGYYYQANYYKDVLRKDNKHFTIGTTTVDYNNNGTISTVNNNYLIPLAIYGIKYRKAEE